MGRGLKGRPTEDCLSTSWHLNRLRELKMIPVCTLKGILRSKSGTISVLSRFVTENILMKVVFDVQVFVAFLYCTGGVINE